MRMEGGEWIEELYTCFSFARGLHIFCWFALIHCNYDIQATACIIHYENVVTFLWPFSVEIQARHKSLAAKLREAEQRQAVIAEQQRSLEVMFRRYDEWIKSAQATISEQINLTSGLNDIRDHIIKLHVSGWLHCIALNSNWYCLRLELRVMCSLIKSGQFLIHL